MIECFFDKIKAIPVEKYDEKLMQFMKNFTLNALAAHASVVQVDGIEPARDQWSSTGPYCVSIFWELMQDNSAFGTQMTGLALQAFLEVFRSSLCDECVVPYLTRCADNVRNSVSVCQSLQVAETLVTQLAGSKDSMISLPQEIVRKINDRFNFIGLMISCLVEYRRFSDSKLQQYPAKAQSGVILEGKYTHEQNLARRLRFLKFILLHSTSSKLFEDNLPVLWNEYVASCSVYVTKGMFLQWLLFEDKNCFVPQLKRVFTLQGLKFLFDSLYARCDELALEYSTAFYKCFRRYFVLVNMWEGKLEESEYVRATEVKEVYGLEALWDAALSCKHEKVRELCCQLLVSFYLHPSESLNLIRVDIWNLFVDKVTGKLEEAESSNDDTTILNLINLLLAFFHRMDGEEYHFDSSAHDKFVKMTLTLIAKPGTIGVNV